MPDGKYKDDDFYKANATIAYYRQKLNPVLETKDKAGWDDYQKGLYMTRMGAKSQADIEAFIEKHPFQAYLSQDEIKKTLGDKDYQNYIYSLKFINNYGRKDFDPSKIKGTVEANEDLLNYNYGKRFASFPVSVSLNLTDSANPKRTYSRQAIYNTNTGQAEIVEYGDKTLFKQ